jgi:hypothetical protein
MKLLVSLLAIVSVAPVSAAPARSRYSARAPIRQYLIASAQREIRLARSAAPSSVSEHATVMVLGKHGYVTAARGENGFTCLVMRSWDQRVKSAEFWNPRIRTPQCMNAAARPVLERYLRMTRWVLAGETKTQIAERRQAARAADRIEEPQPGALCYMMSKHQYISDTAKSWWPHVMFYFPHARASRWTANVKGSPVFAGTGSDRDTTVVFVIVPRWSDGSPGPELR